MDKVKKIFLFNLPMSICNFRCHYCYLAQRDASFQGIHPEMKYSPEIFSQAIRQERVGGVAFGNFCADGETLLVKNIDQYVLAFVKEGHYAEVVTNLTVTNVLDKFLAWDKELLKHLEFKCSFHYLELKKRGLLERFAENVKRIWTSGASATVEITPSDELVPYIDEVLAFSQKHFGAAPHLTIARNDRTQEIEYLTKMNMETYDSTWSVFHSDLWNFKKTIFGVEQRGFCYAGAWSLFVDLSTGEARGCYFSEPFFNIFETLDSPIPEKPVGKCRIAHCYNGHALMTFGLIPGVTEVRYDQVRDRRCIDGGHWLQPELRSFYHTQLIESNKQYSPALKHIILISERARERKNRVKVSIHIPSFPFRIARSLLGDERYEEIKTKGKGKIKCH